jgi:hypothetical protein
MVGRGTVQRGWARAAQGQKTEGMAQIRQGMDPQRTWGAELMVPSHLVSLAEAHRRIGQTIEGLRILAQALVLAPQHGAHFYAAELYRLRGELLQQQAVGAGFETHPCGTSGSDCGRRTSARSCGRTGRD